MTQEYEALQNQFTYHAPTEEQQKIYVGLRRLTRELAETFNTFVPDSPEKDQAQLRLREALMWANAGVAIHS